VRAILGLGNPGERYRATRHNAGFLVVEELARRRGLELGGEECRCLVATAADLLLAQPQTYMNRSGYAARCLVESRALAVADLLVVYDDIHLPLGKLRLRPGGSPAGHRGMESIVENLSTADVPRLRLGVGQEGLTGEALVNFVLAPFAPEEREVAAAMIVRAADAAECWLIEGVAEAMNRFNG
jgi:peptidyl-tRNA hydrolase, PTH1 family